MTAANDPDLLRLVATIQDTRKYASVEPSLIARLGAAELGKGRRWKDAVKATKGKLHQVAGAYQTQGIDYATLRADLMVEQFAGDQLRSFCLRAMRHHASTRERLPFLTDYFAQIFDRCGHVSTVLDLACGLNPLALPWMPLDTDVHYLACDIYQDQSDFLNAFLSVVGVPGKAWTCDLFSTPMLPSADVIFLLKTIPCLEQIDQETARGMLATLDAPHIVVSFPLQSIGGRSKGMLSTYRARFRELEDTLSWHFEELQFQTELVYVGTR